MDGNIFLRSSIPHSCSANWAAVAGAVCWVHLDVDSVSAEQLPGDTSFEVVMSDADSVEFDANPSLDITPSRATHTANMPGPQQRWLVDSKMERMYQTIKWTFTNIISPPQISSTLHVAIMFCTFCVRKKGNDSGKQIKTN